MVSQRKRSMFLGLGLTVALVLTVGLLPAVASAASTLNGEQFIGLGVPQHPAACETGGPYSYTSTGTTTGPYPGTFTETGSGTVTYTGLPQPGPATLSASFTIHSGDFLITGTKNGSNGNGCQDTLGNTFVSIVGLSYQATIHTSTGNYADQGTSGAGVTTDPSDTQLFEGFTSSLAQPVLIGPTSKDQCKNNGWKAFPQFKNQGECVSSVQSQSKT